MVCSLCVPAVAQRTLPAPKDDFGVVLVPKITAKCELVAKSKVPEPKDFKLDYADGLVVFEYKVLSVTQGNVPKANIRVTHWGVRRKMVQPLPAAKIGQQVTLRLTPYGDVEENLGKVCRSDTLAVSPMPMFHDVGQEVVLPVDERGRWNYAVEVGRRIKTLIVLRNQLKLVVLGDCQAWFANNTVQYYGEENKKTPVALGVWQEREGLELWKPFTEEYLVRLPKLEWVVLMWNPRYVNATWPYGAKAQAFLRSPGCQFDKQRAADVFKPAPAGAVPLTTEQVLADPTIGAQWQKGPYNEIRGVKFGRSAKAQALEVQKKAGAYKFSSDRWDLLESMAKALAGRKVKLLVVTQPIHPATGDQNIKDKSGVDAAGYTDQVARLKAMEKKYPGLFFCYDFNNGGNNGLVDEDFGNIDHPTQTGAFKATKAIEAYRLKIEGELKRGGKG
jgi:hypothetical protein